MRPHVEVSTAGWSRAPFTAVERTLGFFAALLMGLAITNGIMRSLWIDETLTAWTLSGGWASVPQRALHFQGQSPVFFWLCWPFYRLWPSSELALRLPAVLAYAIGIPLMGLIGARLTDREGGFGAAFLAAGAWPLLFGPFDARPYPLAAFAFMAATYCLFRWTDEGGRTWSIGYAVATGLTLHLHVLFAPVLLLHGFWIWIRGIRLHWADVAVPALVLGAACLPLLGQILLLRDKWTAYAFAPMPTGPMLARASIPGLVWIAVGTVLVTQLFVVLSPTRRWKPSRLDRATLAFTIMWLVLPPLLLFLISHARGASVFLPRYYSWQFPGAALTAAVAVHGFPSRGVRLSAYTLLFVMIAYTLTDRRKGADDDWRSAAAIVNERVADDAPVMLWTGLTETRVPEWVRQPANRSYLSAPFRYYPVRARLLPVAFTPGATSGAEFLLPDEVERLSVAPTVWFVIASPAGLEKTQAWARAQGWSLGGVERVGRISLFRATRS